MSRHLQKQMARKQKRKKLLQRNDNSLQAPLRFKSRNVPANLGPRVIGQEIEL